MSQSSDIGADVTAWQPTDRDDVLCVGDRVLWPRDGGNEYGTVRWIGVLEGDTSNEIHAGVEFDNPVGKGTGKFRDQRLFYTQYGHAALVPLMGLVKLVCDDLEIQQHTQNTRQDDHKAHEVHLNKIRKLSCTICMELFRSPRLLPCHHTFCLECLQKLAAEHKSNRFPCPTCRQHAPVPSDGLESLQINFYLEDDLREAHNAEQGQAGARTSIETVTRHHQEECGATGSQSQHDVLQEISDYKQTIRQHQQQLEHLSGTIAEQEQFMVDFQEQKQRLRQRIRELEKDNKQQKGLLEICVEEKERLQQEIHKGREEDELVVDYKRTIHSLMQHVSQLEKDETQRFDQVDSYQREIRELKQSNSQLLTDYKKRGVMINSYEQQIRQLRKDKKQIECRLNTCRQRTKTLEGKIQKQQTEEKGQVEQDGSTLPVSSISDQQQKEQLEERVKILEKRLKESGCHEVKAKELQQRNDILQKQKESLHRKEREVLDRVQELENSHSRAERDPERTVVGRVVSWHEVVELRTEMDHTLYRPVSTLTGTRVRKRRKRYMYVDYVEDSQPVDCGGVIMCWIFLLIIICYSISKATAVADDSQR